MNSLNNTYFLLIIIVPLLFSCGKSNTGCDDNKICYTEKPSELLIQMSLSKPDGLQQQVEVALYEGYIDDEDRKELLTFTTNASTETIAVPVDKRYSATAKYVFADRTLIVVFGDRVRARSFTNCEITCWDWDDIPFDLRIKE